MSWEQVLAIAALLLGGGGVAALVTLYLARAQRQKLSAERRKIAVETAAGYAELEAAARKRALECEERERQREEELEGAVVEIRKLMAEKAEAKRLADLLAERFGALQLRYPLAATLDNLRRLDAAWAVVCECGLPLVLSSTEGGGSFLRVTPVFAAMLDMTPEEVVEAGPWNLLLPEPGNVERTRLAEADARAGEAVIVANTYRARDGSAVRLLWRSTAYMMLPSLDPEKTKMVGFALSFVTLRRRSEEPSAI